MIDSVSMFSDMALLETQEGAGTTQGESPSEIEDAARQFEAMLADRDQGGCGRPFEGMFASSGGDIFQELFDQELSNEMLGNGEGLGSPSRWLVDSRESLRVPQSAAGAPGLCKSGRNPAAHGDTVYPVQGRVSLGLWESEDPIEGSHRHHNGLDIAAPRGRPFTPFETGWCPSGERGSYGNLVIVDHGDGLETRYAHCAGSVWKEGQRVQAGDTLATVGSTGRSTGPHLHLEARKEGEAVDPAHLLVGRAKNLKGPVHSPMAPLSERFFA